MHCGIRASGSRRARLAFDLVLSRRTAAAVRERSRMRRDLSDEYRPLIHPLILGAGRRLFRDSGGPARLRLTHSVATTTGVLIAAYVPTGGHESRKVS